MIHQMKLRSRPFEKIKSGYKTIEMRLFDEKRRKVGIGDIIEFTDMEADEKLRCEVKRTFVYRSFRELYSHHDAASLGYKAGERVDPDDMLEYYKKEDVDKYGVVAIEIALIV